LWRPRAKRRHDWPAPLDMLIDNGDYYSPRASVEFPLAAGQRG
jgi:hypothetical protein